MKFLTPLLLSVIVFVGCSTDDELNFSSEVSNPQETHRTLEEAISIAEKASNDFAKKVSRATISSKKADCSNIEVIRNKQSRSVNNGLDTLMYIIPYADNDGFAVVSANPATEGLIAYIEHGSYEEREKVEGFNSYMNSAINYIIDPDRPIKRPGFKQYKLTKDTLSIVGVAPKLEVAWGQEDIEGALTPHGIAGCSIVAMAQIMSYFERPIGTTITFDGAPCSYISIDWNDIKAHKGKHSYFSCTASAQAETNLSLLMRQLGELCHSDYSQFETSTRTSEVRGTFIGKGYYISADMNYSGTNFYNDLSQNKLIYFWGQNNNSEGHSFVIDGVMTYYLRLREWEAPYGSDIWTCILDEREEKTYLHINWGWHGDCNGYFSKGVFDARYANHYDYSNTNNISSSTFNFTNNLKYFTVRY